MSNASNRRVSVREYHLPYLETFGEVLGTNDLSEIINHILNCHRLGCPSTSPSQSSTQKTPIAAAIASTQNIHQQPVNNDDLVPVDMLTAV